MSPWRTIEAEVTSEYAQRRLGELAQAWKGHTFRTMPSRMSQRTAPLRDIQCRRKKVTKSDER